MLVRGRRAPIAGRVCMDHTMIDVTDVAGRGGRRAGACCSGAQGGAAIGADELGGWCDTIAYEVLTSVGQRVPRVYVEEFDA